MEVTVQGTHRTLTSKVCPKISLCFYRPTNDATINDDDVIESPHNATIVVASGNRISSINM